MHCINLLKDLMLLNYVVVQAFMFFGVCRLVIYLLLAHTGSWVAVVLAYISCSQSLWRFGRHLRTNIVILLNPLHLKNLFNNPKLLCNVTSCYVTLCEGYVILHILGNCCVILYNVAQWLHPIVIM